MNKICALPLIMLILLGILLPVSFNVHAQQATSLYVDPPSIVDTAMTPPKTFTVNVKLADVSDLFGFEFKFFWNSTLLQLTKIIISLPWSPNFIAKNDTTVAGRFWAAASGLAPAPAFTGSTTLASLTFKVLATGSTPLDLRDTKVGNSQAIPIPHDVSDGFFSNLPPASARALVVDPSRISNSSLTAGANFTVNIKVKDAFQLHGFAFTLSYNTTMLDVERATVNAVFSTQKTFINETGGYINAEGTDLTLSGDIILVTITFNVTALGKSALDLHDDVLRDALNAPIVHTTSDGLFINTSQFQVPGDLTGDGVVNIFDFITAGEAFGSTPSWPTWNPDADFAGPDGSGPDGLIDIFDLVFMSLHWTGP